MSDEQSTSGDFETQRQLLSEKIASERAALESAFQELSVPVRRIERGARALKSFGGKYRLPILGGLGLLAGLVFVNRVSALFGAKPKVVAKPVKPHWADSTLIWIDRGIRSYQLYLRVLPVAIAGIAFLKKRNNS